MFNPKYKPKSQKYYSCICQPNMLAKRKNSQMQPKYKRIVWFFTCEWIGEAIRFTTDSIWVIRVLSGPDQKLTDTEIYKKISTQSVLNPW